MELWEKILNKKEFVLIAGPCAVESLDHALMLATEIKRITEKLGIVFVYKSSFDKANRTSIKSYRGPGFDEGLNILKQVKEKLGISIITDVHLPEQIPKVAEVVDIIQIPAFLCRQTDLLIEAGKTNKIINVKKGQFLSPKEVINIVKKINSTGNKKVLITERGTSFGYNNLVVDMRSLKIIGDLDIPICLDATHSTQMPGGLGDRTGGDREMAFELAKAGVAVGINALFEEVHQDPDNAPSDGPNMIKLENLEKQLKTLKKIHDVINNV